MYSLFASAHFPPVSSESLCTSGGFARSFACHARRVLDGPILGIGLREVRRGQHVGMRGQFLYRLGMMWSDGSR